MKRLLSIQYVVFTVTICLLAVLQLWLQEAKSACCYFAAKDQDINQPGQKAFITWNPEGKRESFTVQPKFEGNAHDFGMVIPTPARPKLDEMPRDFFKDLAIYTILMPLPESIDTSLEEMTRKGQYYYSRGRQIQILDERPIINDFREPPHVVVLESGIVGSLDYKIIVADDANGLFEWLKTNKYNYAGDESTLQFYIQKKWFFTVMKIDSKQMKKSSDGSYSGEVTPTRFTFSSSQCIYPLKITQLSVKDKTDALFYVQSPRQMDLSADWTWMHSYRIMYLNFMLGCSIDQKQQDELTKHNRWLSEMTKTGTFETTKLDWSKKLGQQDLSILEDPLANYGQMGGGSLPPGAAAIKLNDFLTEVKSSYLKNHKTLSPYASKQLANFGDIYQPAKGLIVKYDPKTVGKGYIYTNYGWYPARQAPQDDVKGLVRLKGHLQASQWLTKFRRNIRKQDMTSDLVLAEIPVGQEQTYVRIMPTSPP